ncbi:MAG: hypothetical protein Kow0069_10200 [Promethearchaeota archaeon]
MANPPVNNTNTKNERNLYLVFRQRFSVKPKPVMSRPQDAKPTMDSNDQLSATFLVGIPVLKKLGAFAQRFV